MACKDECEAARLLSPSLALPSYSSPKIILVKLIKYKLFLELKFEINTNLIICLRSLFEVNISDGFGWSLDCCLIVGSRFRHRSKI